MKLSNLIWLPLFVVLFVSTFSLQLFLTLFSSVTFLIIGIFVALYVNCPTVKQDYHIFEQSGPLQLVEDEEDRAELKKYLSSYLNIIEKSDENSGQTEASFTGHLVIDEQIHDVLRLAFRDYINSWYCFVSPHQQFPRELRTHAKTIIRQFSQRARSMDIVNYMTTKFVDDFASHLRLYRLAQTQMKELKVDDPNANLLSIFFDLEVKMEKMVCRDLVSEDNESCTVYLSQLTDVLMYLLLPADCFNNRTLRFMLRGIFVKSFLLPLLELFSDPDFINQTIVWLCKSYPVTSDIFLTVIRCSDKSDELEAVKEIVNHEIAVLRSKDTGGDKDLEIKQQLSSLMFVKTTLENRMKCLNEGSFSDSDSIGIPMQIDWKRLFSLPFDVVLKNNIALSYFIEFMSSINAQGYIYFYLNVEGFKVSAEQQLSELQLIKLNQTENHSVDLDSLKEAAVNIYETYLSDKANHKLKIEDVICKKVHNRIHTEKLSESWFDEAQNRIFEIMMNDEHFYPAFKKTNHYIKLLAELDLLKDINGKPEEDSESFGPPSPRCDDNSSLNFDCESLNSLEETFPSGESFPSLNAECLSVTSETSSHSNISGNGSSSNKITPTDSCDDFSVDIVKSGIVREFGNIYAAYVINVVRKADEKWTILRRYSDFHSFHQNILDKFPELKSTNISLPGKRTFNNMSKDFVEQRRHLLSVYLNQILKLSNSRPNLRDHLNRFLQPGSYEKEKFQLSKRVQSSIFNPLKSSVLSVGNAVKSGSENIFDGLQKLGRISNNLITGSNTEATETLDINLTKSSIINSASSESLKVAASLDTESEDNIPLRIMLLLMDEMFDLKSKNLWLRRQIVTFLRQIIQATFGSAINKKIVEFVEDLTSASSIAEYIRAFKNSFWPGGYPAAPQPERSHQTKMRTRIAAKTLLLASFSDELKRIIGNDTTRKGLLCMFDMFQHEHLNRRFILVLFESLLQELFPENHFDQICQRLHSKSHRIPDSDKSLNWPPYLYNFSPEKQSPSKSPLRKRR